MRNKVILHFTNNENKTQITSNETNIESVQHKTEKSKSMYNKQEYIGHLNEVGFLLQDVSFERRTFSFNK